MFLFQKHKCVMLHFPMLWNINWFKEYFVEFLNVENSSKYRTKQAWMISLWKKESASQSSEGSIPKDCKRRLRMPLHVKQLKHALYRLYLNMQTVITSYFVVIDRNLGLDLDVGLNLGRDWLFSGISVLGPDNSNLSQEPRHYKMLKITKYCRKFEIFKTIFPLLID